VGDENVELYLIRHAHAEKLGDDGSANDDERPLSDKGQEQSRTLGSVLQKRGIVFDKLLTSPLLRARQTADAIAQVFNSPPPIEECRALAPGGRSKKVARFLFALDGMRLGLVGHAPDLDKWAGWLIGSKKVNIELPKAGVAYINCPEGPGKGLGTLQWLIGPEWYLESSIADLYVDK
jgi:phosphohistidine phosphatase